MLVLKTDESTEQIVYNTWCNRANPRVETAPEGFLEEAVPKLLPDRRDGIKQALLFICRCFYQQVLPRPRCSPVLIFSLSQSSVSSTSVASQMKTWSPLESREAAMLREVYLVLWAIRKQLRQLARRQERRRRRHLRAHMGPQPDPAQGLKQDARSPL